ncbi:MAG: hypothetical protein C0600_10305 [Ignavibacteria bacterium]|nr:MAG: hypothetical protein C0600_10305 [Ignavibacteria bacterium]
MVQNNTAQPGSNAQSIIQAALQNLWDKAQLAAELIARLRDENSNLKSRLEELETTVQEQQSRISEQDNKAKELLEKSSVLSSVDVGDGLLYLSPDEREALERQIDDLIARINAHLGSDPR